MADKATTASDRFVATCAEREREVEGEREGGGEGEGEREREREMKERVEGNGYQIIRLEVMKQTLTRLLVSARKGNSNELTAVTRPDLQWTS